MKTKEEKAQARLETIRKDRQCKKLPVDASKEEHLKTHLVKMGAKKIVRNQMYEQLQGPSYATANLGVNHPDYGVTIAECKENEELKRHIM